METFNFENYLANLHLFSTEDLEKQKLDLEHKISTFVFEPFLCEKIAALTEELEKRHAND